MTWVRKIFGRLTLLTMVTADLDGFCLALQRDLHEITAVRSARVFKVYA